jgi:uncharacterized protein YhaN
MHDKSDLCSDDKLWLLEAQVKEQEVQIDCLAKVVTELLAAFATHSGDLAAIEAMSGYAKRDQRKTSEVEKLSSKDKFFAARGDLFEMIYNDAKESACRARSQGSQSLCKD